MSATFANGLVYYIANDGWRSIDANGNSVLLVAPSIDRLFRGITCYGYAVNTRIVPTQSNAFPCTFSQNKLWVEAGTGADSNARTLVLDTVRNYWRPFNLGTNPAGITAMCTTYDGFVLAMCGDKKLRQLDIQTSLKIDGSTSQNVSILSPVFDNGTPKQRKEFYTIKVRLQTGNGESATVYVILDDGNAYNAGNVTSNGAVTEVFFDLSQIMSISLSRFFQIKIVGSFSNFTLVDVTVDFDTRPQQLTFLHLLPNNFGNASKKRVRVQPFVIDPVGNSVNITPIVDGTPGSPVNFSGSRKQTFLLFFKTDVFGIDYEYQIAGSTGAAPSLFEFFEAMQPDIVQTLPIARQFDQVGPEELFRYGRIKQMEYRVEAFGTSIPWTMYFNDNSVVTGAIATVNGKEASYFIGLPMGAGGSIVRIVFGPTSFNFHRFYVRLQVAKSGRDTEMEWITLPDPQAGE
jgi:hypothetical protein